MNISVFDLFTIGIGPSSSHTVGPMRAAKLFLESLEEKLFSIKRLQVSLHGSLAFTGKGHGTDKAIILGLMGFTPETVDPDAVAEIMQTLATTQQLSLLGKQQVPFDLAHDLVFDFQNKLPMHPNGMHFLAWGDNDFLLGGENYYSIGGGFVVKEGESFGLNSPKDSDPTNSTQRTALEATHLRTADPAASVASLPVPPPFAFTSAAQLMAHCVTHQLSISQLIHANELTRHDADTIEQRLQRIRDAMFACIDKGCKTQGILPGGLQVKRRAASLYEKLKKEGLPSPQHPQILNWLNVYAMAVNEENASGGRVVTAPTNGAAGVVPAVLAYYHYLTPNATWSGERDYLLTAGAIGYLYKHNASISGAEMGCQGEVGVASSMAAAGLTAALGGSVPQVEHAAEIAMEHFLGLTCDPVKGLVQIPCIERNAMGAVHAVNAAMLALQEDGEHIVSLDTVIRTMKEIGDNMSNLYKETALGGLAGQVGVNVVEC